MLNFMGLLYDFPCILAYVEKACVEKPAFNRVTQRKDVGMCVVIWYRPQQGATRRVKLGE